MGLLTSFSFSTSLIFTKSELDLKRSSVVTLRTSLPLGLLGQLGAQRGIIGHIKGISLGKL